MGITFTRKGYIQVLRDGVVLSEHVEERKAVQSLSEREDGDYVLRYPDVAVTVILRKSDTTPPAVPSDFSASAATATSVTLTLTANNESDFSNYVLERSSDNIGWGYLKSFTGTSTTDTVDVSGSTYYYRAFSIDTRGNRSAYTAVKSAGPYTVNLAWNGTIPNVTFTRGNAQNFDLSSYIIGSSPSITVETGTLPAGVTLNSAQQRLQYDGSSATSTAIVATGISLRLSTGEVADWQSRISDPNVVWYHNFESSAEVNRFRWQNGIGTCVNDGTGDGSCAHVASGGFAGGGFMRITVPAGGTAAQGWVRPFSPLTGATNGRGTDDPGATPLAWNVTNATNYTGTWAKGFYTHPDNANFGGSWEVDGSEFYIQFRCRISSSRALSGQPSGKLAFVGITGDGNTHVTPIQEVVLQSNRNLLARAYTNFGSNFNSALNEPQEDQDGSGTIKQPGGAYSGTCINNISCAVCGCYPLDEWFTVLVHIRPGHHGTSLSQTAAQDTLFELKIAMDGDTSYTTIYSKSNYVFSFKSGVPQGWNAFEPSAYMNNVPAIASAGWTHDYTQVIFSTAEIPPPQV